jgi:hypothetical protein
MAGWLQGAPNRHHVGMDADELYGLPLDQFIPERGALAKELRAEGRRDEAAEVAGLRKPSVAAWAVNQVVRTQSRAVTELWAAGDALRKAHAGAVAGGKAGRDLRSATQRERAAVVALASAARGLLTADGHELSETALERVGETLHAAARDDEAREAVRAGRLERELRQLGLGVPDDVGGSSAPRRADKPKAAKKQKKDVEAEEGAKRERAAARKVAKAAEVKARRAAERASRAVQVAEERRGRAAEALSDADEALAAARADAKAATDAHDRARREVESG